MFGDMPKGRSKTWLAFIGIAALGVLVCRQSLSLASEQPQPLSETLQSWRGRQPASIDQIACQRFS